MWRWSRFICDRGLFSDRGLVSTRGLVRDAAGLAAARCAGDRGLVRGERGLVRSESGLVSAMT